MTGEAALSRYLPPGSPELKIVLAMEAVMGVDLSFPAARNLVEALTQILDDPSWTESSDAADRMDWLKALRAISKGGAKKNWMLSAPRNRKTNCLDGQFKIYPIPAVLIQSIEPVIDKQAAGLLHLYCDALLRVGQSSPAEMVRIADTLRRAISPRSSKIPFVQSLPLYEKYDKYYRTLCDVAKGLSTVSDSPSLIDLRQGILQLVRLVEENPGPPRGAKPRINTGPISTSVAINPYSPFDGVPKTLSLRTRHLKNRNPTEAPDDLFEVGPVELTEEDLVDPDLPQDASEGATRESRYWVNRFQRLVPSDTTRFTTFERAQWVRILLADLGADEETKAIGAGVLALMYVTGRVLESVLDFSVGTAGDLDIQGVYRRRIPRPHDAYVPAPEFSSLLEPEAAQIDLELPPPIAAWVTQYAKEGCSLGDGLVYTRDDVRSAAKEIVDRARDRSRYQRIRMERLSAALAVEIAVAERDPVVTHILCGTAAQAPPILSYYAVHYIDRIKSAYRAAVRRLMDSSA